MNSQKSSCPVCHSVLSSQIFNGGEKTLATLGWPSSFKEATNMEKFPLDYVKCTRCTHIWNRKFNYDAIPYEVNPNRMFNSGEVWQSYLLRTQDKLAKILPKNPIVIDIGCGEGHFVRDLAHRLEKKGRFIGFDPNASEETGSGIEFLSSYFDPLKDITKFEPDLLIMRHVLEHLEEPSIFVEQLAFGASTIDKPIYFFAETPCVDIAINSNRIVDFFYEHPSQFTKTSFTKLLKMGGEILWVSKDYGDEVANGVVKLGLPQKAILESQKAGEFLQAASKFKSRVISRLNKLSQGDGKIAVWGGTGKAATFIQHYGLDCARFPFIVDSDIQKAGTYVPGTGQRIRHYSELLSNPVDIIIIPTQWRAADIYNEIKRENISYSQILIEYSGKLVDFELDSHPYR